MKRTGDRDLLSLRRRQRRENPRRADIDVECLEALHRFRVEGAPIDGSPSTPRPLIFEHEVLGDRHLCDERELLMNRRDSCSERGSRIDEADRIAFPHDLTTVRAMNTAEDLDQRRFSRSVLADETDDLATLHRQVERLERLHAGKRFLDAAKF